MHETSTTPDNLPKPRRRPWLIVSGCIVVAVVVLLMLVVLPVVVFRQMAFRDDPRPDDSRMTPQWSERDPATNPLILFCHAIPQTPARKQSLLPKEVKNLEAVTMARAKEFLAEQSATLAAFDQLRQTDSTTWLWPDGKAIVDPNYSVGYLGDCQGAMQVVLLKAKVLAREGKWDEAMRLSLDIARVGLGMQHAESAPIPLLVGISFQTLGENQYLALATSDGVTRAQLLHALQELSAMEGPRREDLKFSLQTDYQFFLHCLELVHQGKGSTGTTGIPPRAPKFLLKRHRTMNMRLKQDLPIIEGLDQGWREGFAAAVRAEEAYDEITANKGSISFFLDSNFVGKTIYILTASTPVTLTQGMMNNVVSREQRKVLLALRLHELDHGHLPPSLEALVPAYLPAVPEDIYTGKPMLWNARDKVVYSTGGNGIDDGGKIDKEQPRKGLDFGMAYPWKTTPPTSPPHE
ncbi:hypothetical protein [Roseimicrobium sp. ORNL1]|uniref:hypothetical protein n=1 Tax=Roseimicrobium sp. ORNL1 TaxID=2711231 RepID=UPI0013E15B00|nr:hypothetical protein [Roseimicrobium sp. ORNL1]QIF04277.1 hypothetical protein G5S37_23050 [Roseimicrobium sp. ORNL1]